MEQLNNLDVVFLIIIGISALVGIARGMTKEILSILGWVLAAAATYYLTPLVNPITKNYISSEILATVVSGMAILIVFCIIWILVVDKIAAAIRQSKLSAFDRLFGFVFGAARGALIVVLVALMISTLMPDNSKEGAFAESKIFKEASLYVEPLKNMIPQEWIDGIKAKTENLGLNADDSKEDKKEDNKENVSEKSKAPATDGVALDADKKQTDNKNEAKVQDSKDEQAIETNLDVLQKAGEELFNQLAQPKPASEGISDAEPEESDLDKLLDVLEDKIISTDDTSNKLNDAADKVTGKVVDHIVEKVADKVSEQQKAANPAQ